MSYRTIVILLLFTIIQVSAFAQSDSLSISLDSVPKIDTIQAQPSKAEMLGAKIDSLVAHAIASEAFPGCVIHTLYKGEELFSKSYGFHTYDSLQPMNFYDIFDLASVSKNTGGVLAMMKLYEMGLVQLDDPIKDYVKGFGWNKRGRSTIREAMSHQAGLQSWIKFYEEIKKKNGKYRSRTLAEEQSEEYPFKAADGKYVHKDFYQKIKKMIRHSTYHKEKKYIYSDLFFYLVPEIVTNLTGMEYEEFLRYHYYDSLEAATIGFNPLLNYDPSSIVPTEIDTFFRMENIHGTVHDEGAILMKGVSGHAGLFANASDLSKVWQMLLNGGEYKGKRYLKPATIELFSSYQYPSNDSRRGLGFDKPLLEYDPKLSSVAERASVYSFGHSGYTGTFVWVDPMHDLLYIFLSNRVYPSRDHRAIYELNVRPQIHTWLYEMVLPESVQKVENFEKN
ncbi:MAG: serine hydrolase [Cyclobacteriaceae bacterium]|nr:serine hydrolase [Cyclobacteriaceae bacterium SS2]